MGFTKNGFGHFGTNGCRKSPHAFKRIGRQQCRISGCHKRNHRLTKNTSHAQKQGCEKYPRVAADEDHRKSGLRFAGAQCQTGFGIGFWNCRKVRLPKSCK